MKSYEQIKGLDKQLNECLCHAYDRGYKEGYNDARAEINRRNDLMDEIIEFAKERLNESNE